MASRLKRLALAALAAMTAVGLGAPCAMAEGTAIFGFITALLVIFMG